MGLCCNFSPGLPGGTNDASGARVKPGLNIGSPVDVRTSAL